MPDVTLYWLPSCSTCQKAERWLNRRGVGVTKFRDIKDEPLARNEVIELTRIVGGVSDLFSKRAVLYREMKLSERTLSEEEMTDLMTDEYTFLKRPIIMIGEKAVAGFFEMSFEAFLNETYFKKSQASR